MKGGFARLKAACYTTNISMAVVGNLPPLLFLTFRSLYGISYSLLGLLVLVNFFTQLTIDLIFSFFSHKFNIPLTVKLTPVLTVVGLLIYALSPFVLSGPSVYWGLVVGTLVFSSSGGLAEVLISPVIAQLPAEDPDREMSKLHSIYAWGVVLIVCFSTCFLLLFGAKRWQYLTLLLSLVPACSALLFMFSRVPNIPTPEKTSGAVAFLKNKTLWLCVVAIFLGGASEVTMAQWSSSYLEQALGLPKVWGDIFGVALFGAALGLGRSLYAKIGKNIEKVLFFGGLGATFCYLIAAITPFPIIGLVACAFTGFCVSMLWPGSLIVGEEKFPAGGVFIFAMMAAGGDFGASVGPQLVGLATDLSMQSGVMISLAGKLSLTAEQLGMKLGMLIGMVFPLLSVFVYYRIWKQKRKKGLPLEKQPRTDKN